MLPILHLNGYKIAGPTVLARMPPDELETLLIGYGHQPYFVEGDDPEEMHQADGVHAGRDHRHDPEDSAGSPIEGASPAGRAGP